jgi:hypothetical protein
MDKGELPYILLEHVPDSERWALVIQAYGAQMQQAFFIHSKREDIILAVCQAISTEDPLAIENADGEIGPVVPLSRNAWVSVVAAKTFEKQLQAARSAQAAQRFGIPAGAPSASPFVRKQ